MTNHQRFHVDQSTQPIKAISITKETQAQRMTRLKKTADATKDTSLMCIWRMKGGERGINDDLLLRYDEPQTKT